MVNYEQARQLGILFDAGKPENVTFVEGFRKQLEEEGKKVFVLGYVDKKHLPSQLIHQLRVSYCLRRDFSWNLRPRSHFLQQFVKREYDILMDLSAPEQLPMKYLAAVSPSRFKVGAYHEGYLAIFDLTMQVDPGCTAAELAKHCIHYLKIIKTPNAHD